MSVSPSILCPQCGQPKSRTGTLCRSCYDASRAARSQDIESTKARFLSQIGQGLGDSECWLWIGSINPQTGYGRFGQGVVVRSAHRVAYELFVGPIHDGLSVLHRCDVRRCVNPSHLFVGSTQDNLEDAAAKGRINTQKLTADDVREIREMYACGGWTQAELGARFGIGQSQVHRIVNRQTWRFVVD